MYLGRREIALRLFEQPHLIRDDLPGRADFVDPALYVLAPGAYRGIDQFVFFQRRLVFLERLLVHQPRGDFETFARGFGVSGITYIPMSALNGDNVVAASEAMPWYHGPTLLEHLETVE